MNLLEEVAGKMPEDKEKMLDVVKAYQELPESERVIYRVGRRGGTYRSTDDLKRDSVTYEKIKNLMQDVKAKEGIQGVEKFITDMADKYV
jgi:hypothetical protein